MKERIDNLINVIRTRSESEHNSVWNKFVHGLRIMCTKEELDYLEDRLAMIRRADKIEEWDQQFMEATIDVKGYVERMNGAKMHGSITMSSYAPSNIGAAQMAQIANAQPLMMTVGTNAAQAQAQAQALKNAVMIEGSAFYNTMARNTKP